MLLDHYCWFFRLIFFCWYTWNIGYLHHRTTNSTSFDNLQVFYLFLVYRHYPKFFGHLFLFRCTCKCIFYIKTLSWTDIQKKFSLILVANTCFCIKIFHTHSLKYQNIILIFLKNGCECIIPYCWFISIVIYVLFPPLESKK